MKRLPDVMAMTEYLGWAATAVFVASYFFTRAQAIKRVQMIGALLWAMYGILIGASPVIVANVLVFSAAAWTTMRDAASAGRLPRRGA
jgi:uncharacterized protein with PQ loop repeat